ncbi:MAG TPA: cytochrome c3 family protein [Phycisphaerales bacterium]|nr:cytochrome c3 family protein [Phycisphaerales bacterium]HRQ74367.1 cytochrome c3 family protein [Phycisphaerales bacterium]
MRKRNRPSGLIHRAMRLAAIVGLSSLPLMYACSDRDYATQSTLTTAAHTEHRELFPVHINRPAGPPRIDTGMLDDFGRPVTVSCMSCHTTQAPNFATRSGDELLHFHQGLHFAHGGLSCLSCHNPENYNTLRLADGSTLEYPNVMNLCAQCHTKQANDYAHGAHGGMNGYWDLSRGPRTRLNCIDCHDPHAPAFPHMRPTFKPRDRFLAPPHRGEH